MKNSRTTHTAAAAAKAPKPVELTSIIDPPGQGQQAPQEKDTTAQAEPPGRPEEAKQADSDLMRILGLVNRMDAEELHTFAEQIDAMKERLHEPEHRLSVDKASPEFRPVVEWLLRTNGHGKTVAVLTLELLRCTTEMEYEGSIGDDIVKDFTEELARELGNADFFDDQADDMAMAAYAVALSNMEV